jgi:hypothetical protein
VLVEKVDGFDTQPCEAGVASATDVFRRTIQALDSAGIDPETELGGDDDTPTRDVAQETSQQLFVFVRTVDFGGVEEIATKLQVAMKDL